MINAVFIVWRECFEAVLIVGILYAYLLRQENPRRSLRFMWLGCIAGAILSGLLAYGVQHARSELEGAMLEYFEAGMLVTAAFLMTQMCIWMKRHARTLRAELESGLKHALSTTRLIGVATLATLAIAREGFEMVMFFYGMGIEASEKGLNAELIAYSLVGVALTAATAWLYYQGLKAFNAKLFFRITAIFLLVTASTLVLTAVRKLVQMDAIPTLVDQMWDTSAILDVRSTLGQFASQIIGYEPTPAGISVLAYVLYWTLTLMFYLKPSGRNDARVVDHQAVA